MKVVTTVAQLRAWRKDIGPNLGFVPTMGYLHQGHISLVKAAKRQCSAVAVSIFVNPIQFGPTEDLASYPRDLDRDLALLEEQKVDCVFVPEVDEIFPKPFFTKVSVDKLGEHLCGASRPGHFNGVTTILAKLLNMVNPSHMFMGEKDYQQLAIVKRMVADLNFATTVVGCPIVREADGLAMSSRNTYLTVQERKDALCLYESLLLAQMTFAAGATDPKLLKKQMQDHIAAKGGRPDYIEIMDENTLQPVSNVTSGNRVFLAVYMGKTRLIDNMSLT